MSRTDMRGQTILGPATMKLIMTAREKRALERKARLVVHRAASHEEAQLWDLKFWQEQGPRARLSALVALHRDVAAIHPEHQVPVSKWRP